MYAIVGLKKSMKPLYILNSNIFLNICGRESFNKRRIDRRTFFYLCKLRISLLLVTRGMKISMNSLLQRIWPFLWIPCFDSEYNKAATLVSHKKNAVVIIALLLNELLMHSIFCLLFQFLILIIYKSLQMLLFKSCFSSLAHINVFIYSHSRIIVFI